jgi:hypothetical protein
LFFCVAPLASMMMKNLENVTKNTLNIISIRGGMLYRRNNCLNR